MTPTEVKDAHDRIWAERKKAKFCEIKITDLDGMDKKFCIVMLMKRGGIKVLDTKSEVNQFLKELE